MLNGLNIKLVCRLSFEVWACLKCANVVFLKTHICLSPEFWDANVSQVCNRRLLQMQNLSLAGVLRCWHVQTVQGSWSSKRVVVCRLSFEVPQFQNRVTVAISLDGVWPVEWQLSQPLSCNSLNYRFERPGIPSVDLEGLGCDKFR